MPYFLSDQPLSAGATAVISGAEAGHLLKSRRYRNGERFAMQDPAGGRWLVELVNGTGRGTSVRVLEALPVPPPPALRVHVLQAAIKDKAAEWLIQKATELGAEQLSFFPAENSTVSHKQLAAAKTLARWEKIAWEACKQCDRQYPPRIGVLPDLAATLAEALAEGGPTELAWLLHPAADASPADAARNDHGAGGSSARVLVGPEGGFSAHEVAAAREGGFAAVRLGNHTLRAETAALAACALLLFGK